MVIMLKCVMVIMLEVCYAYYVSSDLWLLY